MLKRLDRCILFTCSLLSYGCKHNLRAWLLRLVLLGILYPLLLGLPLELSLFSRPAVIEMKREKEIISICLWHMNWVRIIFHPKVWVKKIFSLILKSSDFFLRSTLSRKFFCVAFVTQEIYDCGLLKSI